MWSILETLNSLKVDKKLISGVIICMFCRDIQEAVEFQHAWPQLIAKLLAEWTSINVTLAGRKISICIELLHIQFTSENTRSRCSIAIWWTADQLIIPNAYRRIDTLVNQFHCALMMELKEWQYKIMRSCKLRFIYTSIIMINAWINAL